MTASAAARLVGVIERTDLFARYGRVVACNGLLLESIGPNAALGDLCVITDEKCVCEVEAEIVGFRDDRVLLMPYSDPRGLSVGDNVRVKGQRRTVPVGEAMLGRVLDALGVPIDGLGPVAYEDSVPLYGKVTPPLQRAEISEVLSTGVRAIDVALTLGRGQRMGIFAGSGVGKSTLLGMLTKNAKVDVVVVAMVGERGREVGDFITHTLGPDGLARSVVIAATADQPPLLRIHAVHAAHAVAEYFRDRGLEVLLILDSMTRFAMAQREVGIAAGEPPVSRGYPSSVFTWLPQILERCGSVRDGGSITAVYSVLVEGDDMNEPVADHMRAILDGHIVLTRELADRGHLPAIDVLRSVSRLMGRLATHDERLLARDARAMLAAHERARDLISMGAYQPGYDAVLDAAVAALPELEALFRQEPDEHTPREEAVSRLAGIVNRQGDVE